jgi:hypothetical protein
MFKNLALLCCVVPMFMWTVGCVASAPGDPEPASGAGGRAAGMVKPAVAKPAVAKPTVARPVPLRRELAPGATTGDVLPPKPANLLGTQLKPGNFTWVVTTTASPTVLWPTEYATITVTANSDVGPTPYYLRIFYYDTFGRVNVATCGSGTTCSGSVTRPSASTSGFSAGTLEFWGTVEDANGVIQMDDVTSVFWHGAETALSASSPTTGIGTSVTLTATTDQDIGPTPFFLYIWEHSTSTVLAACGFGTSCSVEVSQAEATTHEYRAYLAQFPPDAPGSGIVEASPISYVTWAAGGWSIQLTADRFTQSDVLVTATTSSDIEPTPYFTEIFDDTHTLIKLCQNGQLCRVWYTPSESGSSFVAFVSPPSETLPPPGAVASSVTVTSTQVP